MTTVTNVMSTQQSEVRIEWICGVCDTPIADGDGYVEMPESEEIRVRATVGGDGPTSHQGADAVDTFTGAREVRQTELKTWAPVDLPPIVASMRAGTFTLPTPGAHWWAVHEGCDPKPDATYYWFSVRHCRTTVDVVRLTAHLDGMSCQRDSNWMHVIRSVAHGGAVRLGVPPSLRAAVSLDRCDK